MKLSSEQNLPPEFRDLVNWSVAHLGQVIERELGRRLYLKIEGLRKSMARLRDTPEKHRHKTLKSTFKALKKLSSSDQMKVARAFTLMLELMNVCENAHRSFRLSSTPTKNKKPPRQHKDVAITYVLTAHPTEARAPNNIAIFREIQSTLFEKLRNNISEKHLSLKLFHQIELAWRIPITRLRSPKVEDEAEHIYTMLLNPETLESLMQASHDIVPLFIRTWVGGDKDGHPGVNEKAMLKSLSLSRLSLIRFLDSRLTRSRHNAEGLLSLHLKKSYRSLDLQLRRLKLLRTADARRVLQFQKSLHTHTQLYQKHFNSLDPLILQVNKLVEMFPGLVVPLELREASDVLLTRSSKKLAIDRMLETLERLSRGGNPKWYARSLIVSMAGSLEHIAAAHQKVVRVFKTALIPIVPLFEQREALRQGAQIVGDIFKHPAISRDIKKLWGNRFEVMVGYSDSSKENGALLSRLEIAHGMQSIDAVCRKAGIEVIFFHGSGGSVDRGGGSVQDQTAWWPHSALRRYKVTVQGEMIERSLASSEITRSQLEHIFESIDRGLTQKPNSTKNQTVLSFAEKASHFYREKIKNPDFLELTEKATPYSQMNLLKIGSRPSSRQKTLAVSGLRAIPWVLCWTQTRVLFPTWWGIGSAWASLSKTEKRNLKKSLAQEPVFKSYVKALGFTLAKVELSVFRLYLENSGLSSAKVMQHFQDFENEFKKSVQFLQSISQSQNPLWFRPWLGASIRLRSPMIHPLNLLQIIAIQENNPALLRVTVTGIASGMLTTG